VFVWVHAGAIKNINSLEPEQTCHYVIQKTKENILHGAKLGYAHSFSTLDLDAGYRISMQYSCVQ